MNTFLIQPTPEVINAENEIAALLSIVPGLGHIYKGRFAAGFFWMFASVCRSQSGSGSCSVWPRQVRVCFSRLRVGSQSPRMPTAGAISASIIGFSRTSARQMKITLSTESSGGASPGGAGWPHDGKTIRRQWITSHVRGFPKTFMPP